jgi:hypothetical protein
MMALVRLPIILIILVSLFLAFMFFKSIVYDLKKGNKKQGLVKLGVGLFIIFGYYCLAEYGMRSKLSAPLGANIKQYIMSVDQIEKSNSGTMVKLDKVFFDIDYISFSVGIKGKEKLVAVELKKALEDKDPLKEIQGIWLGKRISYDYGNLGISYKTEGFIDPLYLVCYLSNGEEISFKVEDKMNIKEKSKIIQVNKEVDIDSRKLMIKEVTSSLSNTTIFMTSEEGRFDLKAYIIKNGTSHKLESSWAGGGKRFDFQFYSKPVYESGAKLKLVPNGSDKEYIIDLE